MNWQWISLFACAMGFLLQVARAEEPTFRSEVQYVAVDVQVLSGDRPVSYLATRDFQVWDEKVPQRITSFELENIELDVLVLLDGSASTMAPREAMVLSAAQAMSRLHFRDRVGLLVFNSEPYLVAPLTWDRTEIIRKLLELPPPAGGTELNTSIRAAVEYLKLHSRKEARRALVVLTDNVARKTSGDQQVRYDLWEADTVLNAVLFKTGYTGGNADVRKFVEATGGEAVEWRASSSRIIDLFGRILQRYLLTYRAPVSAPGSVRNIRVDVTPEARARIQNLRIRARTGYISGRPGSQARKHISSPQ